ncbi:polysaccharide deacetylase family protein [Streptomyces avermitilis]|uniref:polysaccharide deacetylase family protein n=1 Tax=Streptomyces avermitilis TaxID=33903 RepID=UPI0033A6EBED
MTARQLVAGLLAATLLTGCAQSVDPIERLGKKAAQKVRRPQEPSAQTYRRWGLPAPLAPAPAPDRPRLPVRTGHRALPPVVDRVPTHDKVVFLTYDVTYDGGYYGAEKDPRFTDMVRELRLPVSVFVTDSEVGPGYAHVARLRSVGATVQNGTLGATSLRGLPYAEQRAGICGGRDRLSARFGPRPSFLRPPAGAYDRTTLRAAADCGVTAVVLWRASMRADELSYRGRAHRLHRGDIVLAHPRNPDGDSLTTLTARLLRRVEAQGFTVGRLEDYL